MPTPRRFVSDVLERAIPADDKHDLYYSEWWRRGSIKRRQSRHSFQVDLVDYYDEVTGFAAMERTTAYSTAIVAHMMGSGVVKPGASTPDPAVPAQSFVEQLRKRGFNLIEESE